MKRPTTATEQQLESLLRGEIAAAETYKIAIDKLDGNAVSTVLREIQQDHGEAIGFLYRQLAERGVEPTTESGPWGTFARSIEGAATMIGERTALSALREGEFRGLKSYESAMDDSALPNETLTHLRQSLVPCQQRHIRMLDRLVDAS